MTNQALRAAPPLIHFTGGPVGPWRVQSLTTLCGDPIAPPACLSITASNGNQPPISDDANWTLCGVISNLRYTTRQEANALVAVQAGLGRPEALCAALIPIRKSAAWWALPQDERRAIYEEQSRHTTIGMDYLPQIARRLHHSRDLGEPFDFLTWFEFAPEHSNAFDELLRRLRATQEWSYVDREIDIRLTR